MLGDALSLFKKTPIPLPLSSLNETITYIRNESLSINLHNL